MNDTRYAIHLVPGGERHTLVGLLVIDEPIDLDVLQEHATGGGTGYVECLTLADGITAWFDEEGRMRGLPTNPAASAIAGRMLVGPCLLTGTDGPEVVGLTREQAAPILARYGVDLDDHVDTTD